MLVYMITLILKSHKRAEKGKSCLVHVQIKLCRLKENQQLRERLKKTAVTTRCELEVSDYCWFLM